MISPSSPSDIKNVYCTFKQGRFSKITNDTNSRKQAWENSPHFATPPLRNERRNSILMTRHYPDLGSASDWLKKIFHAARPIRSTTKIWVMTRYQYAIPAPVSQKSFSGETSGAVAKCKLKNRQKKLELWFSHRIQMKFNMFCHLH